MYLRQQGLLKWNFNSDGKTTTFKFVIINWLTKKHASCFTRCPRVLSKRFYWYILIFIMQKISFQFGMWIDVPMMNFPKQLVIIPKFWLCSFMWRSSVQLRSPTWAKWDKGSTRHIRESSGGRKEENEKSILQVRGFLQSFIVSTFSN